MKFFGNEAVLCLGGFSMYKQEIVSLSLSLHLAGTIYYSCEVAFSESYATPGSAFDVHVHNSIKNGFISVVF